MDEIGKFFAIAGAAARIQIENDITLPQHLFFEIETVAIVGEGTAVNLQNERILLGRIEIRRMDDPALDLALVL